MYRISAKILLEATSAKILSKAISLSKTFQPPFLGKKTAYPEGRQTSLRTCIGIHTPTPSQFLSHTTLFTFYFYLNINHISDLGVKVHLTGIILVSRIYVRLFSLVSQVVTSLTSVIVDSEHLHLEKKI